MSEYQAQYTIKKELNFLVLIAIKDLFEKCEQDIRNSISKEMENRRQSIDDLVKKKIRTIRIPLHEIENRLAKNKSIWNAYDTKTSFDDKLSETLSAINGKYGDLTKAILCYDDGGWYRGSSFDAGLKNAAKELADSLDFDMAAPIEVAEPEYEKIHVDKKTVMTYQDFQKLAAIVNEDIYKVIGHTAFEQSAWLRKEFGKALGIKE